MTHRQRLRKRRLFLRRLGADHSWEQMTEGERRQICPRHNSSSAFYSLRRAAKAMKARAEKSKA